MVLSHLPCKHKLALAVLLPVLIVLVGCMPPKIFREATNIPALESGKNLTGALRVYDNSHFLYVLPNWSAASADSTITGYGFQYNLLTGARDSGLHTIKYANIALVETDSIRSGTNSAFFTSMIVVNLIGYGICATNPKACFGSCPTFYAGADKTICAEGFSASIARAFEADDVDYLGGVTPTDSTFTLRVTNEALETHNINEVQLLAVPKGKAGVAWAKESGFVAVEKWLPLTQATTAGNTITPLLASADRIEYTVFSDSLDILAKDTIELQYTHNTGNQRLGLFLAFRQSLMVTFYMYKMIALMGDTYGYWLSRLESGDASVTSVAENPFLLLGGIQVQAYLGGKWVTQGEIVETGPLAVNYEYLPVANSNNGRYRLILTRGMWRLDNASLAVLGSPVQPITINPASVMKGTEPDSSALNALSNAARYLVTNPGDEYTINYALPGNFCNYDYFIRSRGYYYEWNREPWLKDKDLSSLLLMARDPEAFLRKYAAEFRAMEPVMDKDFWESRYKNR